MRRLLFISSALALSASAAAADPQIPNWANPSPAQPVATDGSPLPHQTVRGGWLAPAYGAVVTGRSAAVSRHRR